MVAESVVDLAEPVEVHQQQRERATGDALEQNGVLDLSAKRVTVRQASQRVVEREVLKRFVGQSSLGNVAKDEQSAWRLTLVLLNWSHQHIEAALGRGVHRPGLARAPFGEKHAC